MTSAPGRGPLPARTDRPRAAALRVLRAVAATTTPITLAELTATLGGHPNTTRAHLERLVVDGFVLEAPVPTSGRGRPAHAYEATVAGLQVAMEDPDRDGHDELVDAVAEHLVGTDDPVASALSLGAAWGRRLAASGSSDLVSVLAAQGFTPEASGDEIALRTCPLLASARQWPAVVCAIHQGLVDAVSPEPLRLVPFAVPGACLIRRPDRSDAAERSPLPADAPGAIEAARRVSWPSST